jgi:hypothetical protein
MYAANAILSPSPPFRQLPNLLDSLLKQAENTPVTIFLLHSVADVPVVISPSPGWRRKVDIYVWRPHATLLSFSWYLYTYIYQALDASFSYTYTGHS